jgi:enamine deaminase RidA (YjgF/YER057c/UK114 family)
VNPEGLPTIDAYQQVSVATGSRLMDGIGRARASIGTTAAPPATLIGVAALDVPEHLVEVEATAVLD